MGTEVQSNKQIFKNAALEDHEIYNGKGWRLCYLNCVSGVVASCLSDLLSSFPLVTVLRVADAAAKSCLFPAGTGVSGDCLVASIPYCGVTGVMVALLRAKRAWRTFPRLCLCREHCCCPGSLPASSVCWVVCRERAGGWRCLPSCSVSTRRSSELVSLPSGQALMAPADSRVPFRFECRLKAAYSRVA